MKKQTFAFLEDRLRGLGLSSLFSGSFERMLLINLPVSPISSYNKLHIFSVLKEIEKNIYKFEISNQFRCGGFCYTFYR